VFESDRESFRDLYRIDADGSGLRRLTENREGNFDPAVSPDGRWIAFVSSRDGDAEIYVMRADGGGERRLTAFHRDDWGPRWSPDGRTLAFLSNREGADRVFLVSPDGTGLRKLSAGTDSAGTDSAAAPWQEADPAWSPDGTHIALTRHLRPGESHVRIVDVRTGGAREVRGAEAASQPAWSPDGRHLAFTAGSAGDAELWIARADGSHATRITHSNGADWLPRWVR
ncbi:MAG: TolB family protein, partial [Longimicrobiaceae bacterium]